MPQTETFPLDDVLSRAVDVARDALEPIAEESEIGDYLGVEADGKRLVTHSFECLKPGYVGWRWVSTLARVPRGRKATVCEIDLLPGEGALLAPPWIPWADRLLQEEIEQNKELPPEEVEAQKSQDEVRRRRKRRRLRKTYSNARYIIAMDDSIRSVQKAFSLRF